MENINWADMVFLVAVTIALVKWIKELTQNRLGQYYMLVSMGFAFAIVFLSMADSFVLLDFIRNSVIVGLSASGVFDVATRISGK